jgi:hypothetical protein
MKILITENQFKVLIISEARLEDVVQKYVGDGKPISNEKFEEIRKVTNNEKSYNIWLILRIAGGVIKDEDVYKYEQYFKIFTKYKRLFPIKDISQIKTIDDVETFIRKCIEIKEKDINLDVKGETSDGKNYVSPNDIQKLESVGIKYHGIADGYQVFEVPNESKDNPEAKKRYREILGRCAGREQGASIQICTMSSGNYFENYLKDYPGSSYWVMFNMSDRNSPYQFHYESNQFMDKNDTSLI